MTRNQSNSINHYHRFTDLSGDNYLSCPVYSRLRTQLNHIKDKVIHSETAPYQRARHFDKVGLDQTLARVLEPLYLEDVNAEALSACSNVNDKQRCVNAVRALHNHLTTVNELVVDAQAISTHSDLTPAMAASAYWRWRGDLIETLDAGIAAARQAESANRQVLSLSAPALDRLAFSDVVFQARQRFRDYQAAPVQPIDQEIEPLLGWAPNGQTLVQEVRDHVANALTSLEASKSALEVRFAVVTKASNDIDAAHSGRLRSYLENKDKDTVKLRAAKAEVATLSSELAEATTAVTGLRDALPENGDEQLGDRSASVTTALNVVEEVFDKDSKLYLALSNPNAQMDFGALTEELTTLYRSISVHLPPEEDRQSLRALRAAGERLREQRRLLEATAAYARTIPDVTQRTVQEERINALGDVAEVAAGFRLLATAISYQIASVEPPDDRLRIDLAKTANAAAEFANQLTARANALSLQAQGIDRRAISTGQYLRDTQPTAFIEIYDWLEASTPGRIPVRERIDVARRLFADDNWSKINEVYASGAGDVSMAFIRDELGNWNLKSFDADPSDVTGAYADLGGELLSRAVDVATSGGVYTAAEAASVSQLVGQARDAQAGTSRNTDQAAGALIGQLDLQSVRADLIGELNGVKSDLDAELATIQATTSAGDTPARTAEQARADARAKAVHVASRYEDLINALQMVVVSSAAGAVE